MPNTALILGNGLSRLDHMDFVNRFDGSVYGSNWIFKELVNGSLRKLDKINGEYDALEKANEAKTEYGFLYELWGFNPNTYHIPGITKYDKILPQYSSNSGLNWVVKLLMERQVDKIFLVGFDMGGKDLFVPNHDHYDKTDWVRKWRLVLHDFGHDRIQFIGKDHLPFLLSNEDPAKYAKMYLLGEDHITNDKPVWTHKKSNKVIILGNGLSRLQHKGFINSWKDEIWGCNHFFTEYNTVPKIDRIFCDAKTIREAYEFRVAVKKDWLIYAQTWINGFKDKPDVLVVNGFKGITSGATAVEQALIENYDKILLTGFDFGGSDIYTGKEDGTPFIQHFKWIMEKYNTLAITFMDAPPPWFKHNTTVKKFFYPPKDEVEPPYPDYLAKITRPKNTWHTGF